jgi:hypothetical protein
MDKKGDGGGGWTVELRYVCNFYTVSHAGPPSWELVLTHQPGWIIVWNIRTVSLSLTEQSQRSVVASLAERTRRQGAYWCSVTRNWSIGGGRKNVFKILTEAAEALTGPVQRRDGWAAPKWGEADVTALLLQAGGRWARSGGGWRGPGGGRGVGRAETAVSRRGRAGLGVAAPSEYPYRLKWRMFTLHEATNLNAGQAFTNLLGHGEAGNVKSSIF